MIRRIFKNSLQFTNRYPQKIQKKLFTQSLIRLKDSTDEEAQNFDHIIEASDSNTYQLMKKFMIIENDFVSKTEEDSLLREVEPYMKRLRYEYDHWDNVSK